MADWFICNRSWKERYAQLTVFIAPCLPPAKDGGGIEGKKRQQDHPTEESLTPGWLNQRACNSQMNSSLVLEKYATQEKKGSILVPRL